MVFLPVLCVLFFANGVTSTFLLGQPGNGETIPIDVSVGDGYAILVSGPAYPPQDFFRPSINLYDFDQQFEARKIVQDGVCYVKQFTGTADQAEGIFGGADGVGVTTQVVEEWNVAGEQIPSDKLDATVGAKTAEFCSGYNVFWMGDTQAVTTRQARMIKRQWSGNLGATYTQQGGFSANGGLSYNNGGLSGNIGAGYSQSGGFSASVGVKFTFRK